MQRHIKVRFDTTGYGFSHKDDLYWSFFPGDVSFTEDVERELSWQRLSRHHVVVVPDDVHSGALEEVLTFDFAEIEDELQRGTSDVFTIFVAIYDSSLRPAQYIAVQRFLVRLRRPSPEAARVTLVDVTVPWEVGLVRSAETPPPDIDTIYSVAANALDKERVTLSFRLDGAPVDSQWRLAAIPVSYGATSEDLAHGKPFSVLPTLVDGSLVFQIAPRLSWFSLSDRVSVTLLLFPANAPTGSKPVVQKTLLLERAVEVTPSTLGFVIDEQKTKDLFLVREESDRTVLGLSVDHLDTARLAFSVTGKSRKKGYLYWRSPTLHPSKVWPFAHGSLVFSDFHLFRQHRSVDFAVILSASARDPFPELASRTFHVDILDAGGPSLRELQLSLYKVTPATPLTEGNVDYAFEVHVNGGTLQDSDEVWVSLFADSRSPDILSSFHSSLSELARSSSGVAIPVRFRLPTGPSRLLSLDIDLRDAERHLLGSMQIAMPFLAHDEPLDIFVQGRALETNRIRAVTADHLEIAFPSPSTTPLAIPFTFPRALSSPPFDCIYSLHSRDQETTGYSAQLRNQTFLFYRLPPFFNQKGDEAILDLRFQGPAPFDAFFYSQRFYLSAVSFAPQRLPEEITPQQLARPARQIAPPVHEESRCKIVRAVLDPPGPLSQEQTRFFLEGSIQGSLREDDRLQISLFSRGKRILQATKPLREVPALSRTTGEFKIPLNLPLPQGSSDILSLSLELSDASKNILDSKQISLSFQAAGDIVPPFPSESPWETGRVQVGAPDLEEDVPLIYLDRADLVSDADIVEEEEKT